MSEENKDVVRRVEEAWNSGDLDALDELFAPEFDNSSTGVPGVPPGLEGAKTSHQMSMRSFPDRRVEVQDLIAEGDTVVARCLMTGTNQGGLDWAGVPANGKQAAMPWVSVYRLRDGKIVEHHAVMDLMLLMQQLGAMPGPAGT